MIQQVSAYRVGEQFFPTIQEAQRAELSALFNKKDDADAKHLADVCSDRVIEHADEVIAILTCTPSTKKPRSDKGKKRKAKTEAAPTA